MRLTITMAVGWLLAVAPAVRTDQQSVQIVREVAGGIIMHCTLPTASHWFPAGSSNCPSVPSRPRAGCGTSWNWSATA